MSNMTNSAITIPSSGDAAVDFLNECTDNSHPVSINDLARAAQSKRDSDATLRKSTLRSTHQWLRLCSNGVDVTNPIMRVLITKHANKIARKAGAGSATKITISDKDEVLHRMPAGNRKKSDGSYVSNAYVRKGWSSCYSQSSVCEVSINARAVLAR